MSDIATSSLLLLLILLIFLSAFFSGSETALMSLNRYRLRYLSDQGQRSARLAEKLLAKPERLIGLILLGNNFINILASSIATVLAIRFNGEGAIPMAAGILTLVILIFSEVAPKTMAALHPERLAFPAAWIYAPLLKIAYPLVWLINLCANTVLKLLNAYPEKVNRDSLSKEELKAIVNEGSALIPQTHKSMLLAVLELEQSTAADIMIPRQEIDGIDLDAPWQELLHDLSEMPYTHVLVYRGNLDTIEGFIHARALMKALMNGPLNLEKLQSLIKAPYYVPETTTLSTLLVNMQKNKQRVGLVVDEYGDVQGLITIHDLLEEIVGEFTTDPNQYTVDVRQEPDGSYLVSGNVSLRDLVKQYHLDLPTNGPKTLNGLILEYLENIPQPNTSLLINDHPIEVLQIQDNAVKTARILPKR